MGKLLKGLNKEQRQAVTHGDGPLLIVAGAGTGKTKVITHRIAWLIESGRAKPEEILGLTFTEKAAGEMIERVDKLVPLGQTPTHISTFHSFGDSLLRDFAYDFDLPPEPKLLGEAEQVIFLDEHLFELPLKRLRRHARPAQYLRDIASVINRAKAENKSPEEYLAWVKREERRVAKLKDPAVKAEAVGRLERQRELAAAYGAYERLKRDHDLIDFGDQVYLPLRKLAQDPVILRQLRRRFKYILVDEFQDTNVAQNALVNLLAGPNGNLTVVGDDDQSIFGFQGASLSNILEFESAHSKTRRVVLTANHRSTQPILDAGHRLIQHNQNRLETKDQFNKRLRATRSGGTPPLLKRFETVDDEADFAASYIAGTQANKRTRRPYADFAIIVRTNRMIPPFAQALAAAGIPYVAEGTGRLFDEPAVRLCIDWLRVVVDPLDSVSLRRVAQSPAYRFPPDDLFALLHEFKKTHRPLWELLEKPDPSLISRRGVVAANRLRDDVLRQAETAPNLDVARLLYDWLERTGTVRRLRQRSQDDAEVMNLAKFFGRLRQFASTAQDPTAAGWIGHLDDILALADESVASEVDFEQDAVRIITAHKAKGLEFDTVFVVGCVANRFPQRFRPDPLNCYPILRQVPDRDSHLEEERRLFYVAMTRAERQLILTAAADYHTKMPWKLSQFPVEALGVTAKATLPPPAGRHLGRIKQSKPLVPVPLVYRPPEHLELTHTSYQCYQTCPLKYYWDYVVGVRSEPTHAQLYGILLHQVIQRINMARHHGDQVSWIQIKQWYTRGWSDEYFLSRSHAEHVYEQGLATLKRFLAEERGRAAATEIEHQFSFPLKGCTVTGRYDRIDEHKGLVTLVDYKTGDSVTTQEKADKRAADDNQLTLYALAYQKLHGRLPDQVVLNFVDTNLSGVSTRTQEQVNELAVQLEATAAAVKAGQFEPSRKKHECNPFADCPGNEVTHRTRMRN